MRTKELDQLKGKVIRYWLKDGDAVCSMGRLREYGELGFLIDCLETDSIYFVHWSMLKEYIQHVPSDEEEYENMGNS